MPRTRSQLLALLLACAAALAFYAPTAHADEYKMLGCSASAHDPFYTITGNTASSQNPGGIFSFWNNCGGVGGDPPGNAAYLRIEENQASGYAGNGAFLAFNFDTPNQFIHFRAAGGYTREPFSFNDGWRSRLLISGGSAGARELMSQGKGLCNCGDQWATTGTFASHLWPLGGYLDFTRLSFEMVCMSWGGCDRAGVNETDLNGMAFILSDEYPSAVNLIGTEQPFLSGQWVRGPQTIAYNWTELGAGMKLERVKVDGAVRSEIDHSCDVGWSQTNGEYARTYQPCDTGADVKRYVPLDTASLPDGAHTVQACTQDYAQWDSTGSGGESCDQHTIHTDNTPPGKPAALAIRSANPARYLDHFGASFSLPPDPGSPIAKVHYEILGAANQVVVPEQVVSGANPTEVADIQGPPKPGAYHLKLWLEDSVGFQGPAAEVAISHDTTPPAAPQQLHVSGPTTAHWSDKVDLEWRNIVDDGSPIDAVHYEIVDASGNVVGSPQTLAGPNVQAIAGVQTPAQRCACSVRVWLEDEGGNVGAAASVSLPHDTTPPAAPQELHVAGQTSHWADKVDLRWSNVVDAGSPIDVAQYRFLDAAGNPVGPTQTLSGENPEAISGLSTPSQRAHYKVQVWLEDAEGNVGAAASVPLPIDTTPPAAPQGLQVTAPDTPRSKDGFDLHWTDIDDDGSPIAATHYEVLDGAGKLAVPTQTVTGNGIDSIGDVQAPDPSGSYTLKLWLEDQEGNAGAPATVPLSYECSRSPVGGGAHLDASLSADTVSQGQGSALTGALRQGSGAPVAGAPLCVFEQVEGDGARHYLGLAYTDAAGNYRYAVAPGPNRTLRAVYRPGNRRLVAEAQLKTRVKPTLQARKSVIHNGQVAHLEGQIPGPRNDDVVIVLQVRQGKGWLAFRRYRTRGGGHFEAAYPFHRTTRPTTYEFRAQLRESGGYPYLEGDSDPVALKVLPKAKRRRCAKARRRGASKQSLRGGAKGASNSGSLRPKRSRGSVASGSSAQRAKRKHLSSLAKRHGRARCVTRRVSLAKRCVRARRALHRRPTARALRHRAHRLCARAHRKRHARHAHRRAG